MFDESIVKLVNKWVAAGDAGIEPALRICRDLISFKPDPLEREKQARRKESPFDWSTSLDPNPRFSRLGVLATVGSGGPSSRDRGAITHCKTPD